MRSGSRDIGGHTSPMDSDRLPHATAADDRTGLAARVKAVALALGFDRAGIAALAPSRESAFFADWIARGRHGEMAWLARNVETRVDPRRLFEGACSALVVSLVYDRQAPAVPALSAPGQRNSTEGPASADAQGVGARSEPKASEAHQARGRAGNPLVRPGSAPDRMSDPAAPASSRIAKYAGGADYHDVLLERLRSVGSALEALAGRSVRWRA